MSKTAPVVALFIAQLLSWSGAPLYLCLSCDGSVRFDNGPATCSCDSTHSQYPAERHAKGPACQHRHCGRFMPIATSGCLANACGCNHIRISQEQQLAAGSGNRLTMGHAKISMVPFVMVAPIDSSSVLAVLFSGCPAITQSASLTALSSVILRC